MFLCLIIIGVCITLLLWQHPLFSTMKQIILVIVLYFLEVFLPDSMDGSGVDHLLYTWRVMREKLLVIVILTSTSSFITNPNALNRLWNRIMLLCLHIALMLWPPPFFNSFSFPAPLKRNVYQLLLCCSFTFPYFPSLRWLLIDIFIHIPEHAPPQGKRT